MFMLTVKQLRMLLQDMEDQVPVRVALVSAEDGQKLLEAAAAHPNDESIHIKVASAFPAVAAFESDDGGVLVLAFSPAD
jgi:hypothetical protein